MLSWLSVVAVAFLIGFVSIRAWWIERKKRIIVERPNSFSVSKAVHNQEDEEEWWRRIELEHHHDLNREYVERLQCKIHGAGTGTLTKDERAFMERMAKLDAPPRPGVRPLPWPSPA